MTHAQNLEPFAFAADQWAAMAEPDVDIVGVDIVEEPEMGESVTPHQSTGSPHSVKVVSVQARTAVSVIAGFLGLSGFVAACFAGLAAGVPGTQVLLRAIGALFLCWFVGLLIGSAMRVLIEEHLARHHELNPRPAKPQELMTPTRQHN